MVHTVGTTKAVSVPSSGLLTAAAPVVLARMAGAFDISTGGAEMTVGKPDFDDLMFETSRATLALDGVTRRDGSKVTAVPVGNAKRVYARLLEYRHTALMTRIEAHALDSALEHLRARLKFFGESV